MVAAFDALLALVREAAAPGGIGPHEFSRPGGWRERALAAIARAGGAPTATPEPITIGITLEGGLVQGVWSEQAARLPPLRVAVVDFDTEGADGDEVTVADPLPGEDAGRVPEAVVGIHDVEQAGPNDDGPRVLRSSTPNFEAR